MTLKSANQTNFKPGDRVTAKDGAGISHTGHLHHANQCGQFYVLPDSPRQPFYAFPSALTPTGDRQPGFTSAIDDCLGIESIARQEIYAKHMRGNA